MHFSARFLNKTLTALALPLFLTAVHAAKAEPIVVRHAQGETTLSAQPKTVICFDMASLDTLNQLGIEVSGVPAINFPPSLSAFGSDSYKKIGSVFEPDLEAVNALAPDLIIVGGRSSPKYAELAKIAPTIDMTVDANNFIGSAETNIRTLGHIFGKDKETEARLAHLEKSIAALKQEAAKEGTGLLILTTGGKISAYGPGSRFGVLHDAYGIQATQLELSKGTHGQPVSFEFILEKNPDWLFVIDRDAAIGKDGEAAKRLLDNELVGKTTAWQKGQVVFLDAANWYLVGGGLGALQQNVDQLSQAFASRS